MSQVSRIVFSIVKMAKAIVWIVKIVVNCKNIARGTTDPGYWIYNLSYLSS